MIFQNAGNKGGRSIDMHCTCCGRELECEFNTLDEYGRLELYHCYDCDTLYTLRDETISYIRNATDVLTCVYEDLKRNTNFLL